MYLKIINDCELIEKTRLTDTIYFIRYSFIPDFEWSPGQYVSITVTPTHRRSYSIMDYNGKDLAFLIDVKPNGIASQYFESAKVGDKKQILGPYGKFLLRDTPNEKVFISTGTGIAPFVPMIKKLRDSSPETRVRIFSGAKFQNEDIAFRFVEQYLNEGIEYHQCITREEPQTTNYKLLTHKGRVTEIIPQQNLDWQNSEFYICGSPPMVKDTEEMLRNLGAVRIFIEKF